MNLILCLLAIGIGVITGGITRLIGASGVMILLALIILMSFPLHKAIGTSTLSCWYMFYGDGCSYGCNTNNEMI